MAKTPPTAPNKPEAAKPEVAPPPQDLAIDFDAQSEWTQNAARVAYQAYIANSNGLAWDGRPCPTWEDLNHAVRSHWCAAVTGVAPMCREKADSELAILVDQPIAATAYSAASYAAQLQEGLRSAHVQLEDMRQRLEAAGALPADADRVEKLAGELRACRDQLALANVALK
jgi:hypothetical protein